MHYIFDMDGTLIDSMPTYSHILRYYLDTNGLRYSSDLIKTVTPLGFDGTANYFIEHLGLKKTKQEMERDFKAAMLDAYTYEIPAKPCVSEALAALSAAGHHLHVLTASPHITVDPCLARLGLTPFFDHIWSSDDFSGLVKADPEIYGVVAERLGVAPADCIFVDDNLGAVTAAAKAGMHAYGIYDPSSEEYVEEMKKVAEKYIYHFAELL